MKNRRRPLLLRSMGARRGRKISNYLQLQRIPDREDVPSMLLTMALRITQSVNILEKACMSSVVLLEIGVFQIWAKEGVDE